MIQRHLADRELNQARSKPDPFKGPERTACTYVHHYTGTQYRDSSVNISLPPGQHHILDVAKCR